jgi:xylan 1,4-beta-xylosidase
VVEPVELEVDRRPAGPSGPAGLGGRDDFDGPTPAPRWIAVRRHPSELTSLATRPGWLTLHGTDATLDDETPVLVGRRQQHHWCRTRTLVDAGSSSETGLVVYLDHTAHYEVAVRGDRLIARARAGPFDVELGSAAAPGGPVVLRVETGPHPHGSDTVTLGFEHDDGTFEALAEIDGRYLSTEMTGGFIGRALAMYAVGGVAAFDWFDYEALE